MLKISKLTDYAIIILRHIVINKKNKYSAATLSEEIKLNTPTVSKLLKLLAKANILTSFRGISDLFKDILGAISLEDIININSKSGFYEIVSDRLKQEVPV